MISCPACAGVLRAEPGPHARIIFVCSVGHAFSFGELYQAKEETLEQGEWSVVVLLKHLDMILELLVELDPEPETFSGEALRSRQTQARDDMATIVKIIERTHVATRAPINRVARAAHE